MTKARRKNRESGFALLLVFLMAAVVGISLFMEIPRVAMEAQRQKEQLLVERGDQYKRAIKVFLKTTQRWPSKIEDLEKFNNRRFLRRRFIDPMTGKDEWRLVHINNGMLTDSHTMKQKPGGEQKSTDAFQWNLGMGANFENNGAGGGATSVRNRTRQSDNAQGPTEIGSPSGTGMPPDSNAPPTGAPPNGPNPNGNPGNPSMPGMPSNLPPGVPGAPGQVQPGMPITGQPGAQPGMPGAPGFPNAGGMPGQPPGIPGQPVNSQTGGVSPSPYPTMPGAQGPPGNFQQPGMDPQGQNAAVNMINRILTNPQAGRGGAQGAANAPVGSIGGGIAGVGTKAEGEGVMVINDQTNYEDWEFIYDPTKDRPPANPLGTAGTPANQLGNTNGMKQIGTPIGSPTSNPMGGPMGTPLGGPTTQPIRQ